MCNFFKWLFKSKQQFIGVKNMRDLHYIAKLYDPKTGEYVGKFDFVMEEIVGKEDDKSEVEVTEDKE
jgi:hypothetical protein